MADFEINDELITVIIANLDRPKNLHDLVSNLHSGDIVEIIEHHLEEDEAKKLFHSLTPETASEVLIELTDEFRELFLEKLSTKQLTDIVQEMNSDDAADFVAELPKEEAAKILDNLPDADSDEVRHLLQYDEETAGGIMQTELVSLREEQTCADAVELIRSKVEEIEEYHFIFVTDKNEKLVGLVPLGKLALYKPEISIGEIMDKNPISITVDADEEAVANIFMKYDLISVAVTDVNGKLLGRILHDDVLDIITEGSTEDFLKIAGTNDEEFEYGSWINAARYRLPWLVSSLSGGILMAGIIRMMGAPLSQVIALAAFIPVITGMSGNVSTQSSAIVVRGLVLGRMGSAGIFEFILKEFYVGLAMATFCGTAIGFIAWGLNQSPGIGIIVGASLFFAMCTASTIGTLIPILLQKLKLDPVLGAGPIVLTLVDISSLIIYFSFAGLLIHLIT